MIKKKPVTKILWLIFSVVVVKFQWLKRLIQIIIHQVIFWKVQNLKIIHLTFITFINPNSFSVSDKCTMAFLCIDLKNIVEIVGKWISNESVWSIPNFIETKNK